MNTDKKIRTAVNNLALIKVDYENGLCSKRKVAELHSISTTSLWRYAKEYGWVYACRRNEVIDEFSQMSAKRLMSQKQDLLEEHALVLSQLREDLMMAKDMKELKKLDKRVDSLVKCIKAERLCFGMPNEIVLN